MWLHLPSCARNKSQLYGYVSRCNMFRSLLQLPMISVLEVQQAKTTSLTQCTTATAGTWAAGTYTSGQVAAGGSTCSSIATGMPTMFDPADDNGLLAGNLDPGAIQQFQAALDLRQSSDSALPTDEAAIQGKLLHLR